MIKNTHLARTDCRAKNILVLLIVITKLEFIHIEQKVMTAELIEGPDYATLHDAPEAFEGVGMNCADHVFPLAMVHEGMWKLAAQLGITDPAICAQQANLVGYHLADESRQSIKPRYYWPHGPRHCRHDARRR